MRVLDRFDLGTIVEAVVPAGRLAASLAIILLGPTVGRFLLAWAFFDLLLQQAQVVITPGAGFGACGQGYIRISAFNDYAKVQEAMGRLQTVLPKR